MVPSFHTVLFLQKIRKILKLFSHLQRRMRVQVDRPKGLNSLSLWEPKMEKKSSEPYFVSRKNKCTKRTEFMGRFSLEIQKNL